MIVIPYNHSEVGLIHGEILDTKDVGKGKRNYILKIRWRGKVKIFGKTFNGCQKARIVRVTTTDYNSELYLEVKEGVPVEFARIGVSFSPEYIFWCDQPDLKQPRSTR